MSFNKAIPLSVEPVYYILYSLHTSIFKGKLNYLKIKSNDYNEKVFLYTGFNDVYNNIKSTNYKHARPRDFC